MRKLLVAAAAVSPIAPAVTLHNRPKRDIVRRRRPQHKINKM